MRCEYGPPGKHCPDEAEFKVHMGDLFPFESYSCRKHLEEMNTHSRHPSSWTIDGITDRAKEAVEKWREEELERAEAS